MRVLLVLLPACTFEGTFSQPGGSPVPGVIGDCFVDWIPPQTAAPAAGVMVYDAINRRSLIYGGGSSAVWVLHSNDPHAWSPLEIQGEIPRGRYRPAAAYDPDRSRLIVFGGELESTDTTDELWLLSLEGDPRWLQIDLEGERPSPRQAATLVYTGDRYLLFGGRGAGADPPLDDTWLLSLEPAPSWTRIFPANAPALSDHAAAYDPIQQRMIAIGRGSTWSLSLEELRWDELDRAPTSTARSRAGPPIRSRSRQSSPHTATSSRPVRSDGMSGADPRFPTPSTRTSAPGTARSTS